MFGAEVCSTLRGIHSTKRGLLGLITLMQHRGGFQKMRLGTIVRHHQPVAPSTGGSINRRHHQRDLVLSCGSINRWHLQPVASSTSGTINPNDHHAFSPAPGFFANAPPASLPGLVSPA